MKTKLTFIISCFFLFACVAILLSSCSTSNNLASQKNPHYHLALVKVDTHPVTAVPKKDADKAVITPMPAHSPVLACNSDAQLNTAALSGIKQVKKSNPSEYKASKKLKSITGSAKWAFSGSKSIINNKSLLTMNNEGPGTHSYFGLFLLFLILALVISVLSIAAPFLYIFALISWIAAVVFFILWIVNLA